MKNFFFLLVITSITLSIGCSKKNETMIVPASTITDKLTNICRKWQLNTYTIKTDQGDYYFTGTDISTHALRTLTFYKDRNYTAGNNAWSGTFEFSNDSTQIVLTPTDISLIPITLSIDH